MLNVQLPALTFFQLLQSLPVRFHVSSALVSSAMLDPGFSPRDLPAIAGFILAANSSSPQVNTTYTENEKIIASVSQISGILSLSVWLFAQLPQIIENHLNQSVEGVSLLFLSCWIGGDATNLLGCILTRALPFQTCLAAYYCFIDFILSLQFWYYTRIYPRQKVHHNLLQSPNMLKPTLSRKDSKKNMRFNRFQQSPKTPDHYELGGFPLDIDANTDPNLYHHHRRHQSRHRREASYGSRGRSFFQKVLSGSLLSGSFTKPANAMPVTFDKDESKFSQFKESLKVTWTVTIKPALIHFKHHYNKEAIGTTSAWLCSFLYLSSRSPQIIKNYRSKSTKGISVLLFLFAMLGNTFYTISIVSDIYLLYHHQETLTHADSFHDVLMAQTPFIVGSSGTVLFDAIILFQFWYYNRKNKDTDSHHHQHHHNQAQGYFDHDFHMQQQADDEHQQKLIQQRRNTKQKSPWLNSIEDGNIMNHANQEFDTANSFYTNHFNTYAHSNARNKRIAHHPHQNVNPNLYDESSHLLNSNSNLSYIMTPPPPNYISRSSSIHYSNSHANNNNKTAFISNTISALAKSLSRSSSFHHVRSPASHSSSYNGSNHHVIIPTTSQNIHYHANQNGVMDSPFDTSLIPSIIGNYSSISKKMTNDSKIPFSPIDFLHDDFHAAGGGASTNSQNGSLGHSDLENS